MRTPALFPMLGLLVCAQACATGVMPVFDLDFTRSANETLKKIGIHDACIIKASNPITFTYCREGSSTLWKYQALDLDQLATAQSSAVQPPMPISILEVDSAACVAEDEPSSAANTAAHWLAIGLIALSLLFGMRHTYRAVWLRRREPGEYAQPGQPGMDQSLPRYDAMASTKALAAFSLAAGVAIFYFSYAWI